MKEFIHESIGSKWGAVAHKFHRFFLRKWRKYKDAVDEFHFFTSSLI